jgi:hypothetical protein
MRHVLFKGSSSTSLGGTRLTVRGLSDHGGGQDLFGSKLGAVSFRRSIRQFDYELAKAGTSARKCGHYGPRGHADNRRNLFVGHSFQLAKDDHFARARRQHLKRPLEQFAVAFPQECFFWIREASIATNQILVEIDELPSRIPPRPGVVHIPNDL